MTNAPPYRVSPLIPSGASSAETGAVGESEEKAKAEEEEERKPKIGRVPKMPTADVWNDHMTHHPEFRDWCPFGVQGKGISYQHRKVPEEEENIGITASMDWAYMNSIENEDD